MTRAMDAYRSLEKHFARLSALQEAEGLLHWDSSVMMPEGGGADRGEQLAALAALAHDLITAPHVGDLIEQADGADLEPWQAENLREMRRTRAHATAVPGDLVEATSRAVSSCEGIWRQARAKSDFAAVRPALEQVVTLTRHSAQAKAEALGCTVYDALLDQFEPGGSCAAIDPLFADLESFLPPFLDAVLEHQGDVADVPPGPYDRTAQETLGRTIMQAMGLDFRHGRLDVSAHPFCGGTPGDVRITTRYDTGDYSSALMGVIHETGHGLYERGLPSAWRRQPVGLARGMSVHESQSLLMEMQAGRSREFFSFLGPLVRESFGVNGDDWTDEAQHCRAIRVRRGHIRVNADEVTYPLHVILRYRLERAMVEGTLEVADLPGAWNEGFERLLGILVPDHCHGVMQDVHWFDGLIGYFPTYTLGAMTAAQLYAAAVLHNPDIPRSIAGGDFAPLLAWLRPNVHEKASSLSTRELLVQATGKPLDAGVFKAHLTRRYLV